MDNYRFNRFFFGMPLITRVTIYTLAISIFAVWGLVLYAAQLSHGNERLVYASAYLSVIIGGLLWWMLKKQLSPMFNALTESEQRYRLLIDTAQEGIIVAQAPYLRFTNPKFKELTGYAHDDEFANIPFIELVHPDDRETVLTNHQKRVVGESINRYRFRLLKRDGHPFWIEFSGTRIEWDNQPAVLGFITDISEQMRVDGILKEKEKYQRNMEKNMLSISEEQLRTIGRELHDGIGQILTAISYQSKALQISLSQERDTKSLLRGIRFIADQSQRAIVQCKQLAHGLVVFELSDIGLIGSLRELAAQISAASGIDCSFMCVDDLEIPNHEVELHLYRIVQEAVSNAVKHSKCSRISIILIVENQKMTLSIKDNGNGNPCVNTRINDSMWRDESNISKRLSNRRVSGGNGQSGFENDCNASGMGLKFMQYRANQIGASLDFIAPEDGGFEVFLELEM